MNLLRKNYVIYVGLYSVNAYLIIFTRYFKFKISFKFFVILLKMKMIRLLMLHIVSILLIRGLSVLKIIMKLLKIIMKYIDSNILMLKIHLTWNNQPEFFSLNTLSYTNSGRKLVVENYWKKPISQGFPTFIQISLSLPHFFHVKSESVSKACLTLCDPMDCACQAALSMDFPGRNSGVACHSLLQRIFPTQGLNLGPLHRRWVLYHLSH